MSDRELAVRLVCLAAETQRRDPQAYTEANRDPDVKLFGNAAIANALEMLGKHSLVIDVQPTFGTSGTGFTYKISGNIVQETSTDTEIARKVLSLLSGTTSETSSAVAELRADCERVTVNSVYGEDLIASLRELQTCFDNACYIACL